MAALGARPLRALAIVTLLAAATVAAGGQTPAEPPMPYEQAVHPCPDRACQPGLWTVRVPVVVRLERGRPAAAFRLNAGAQVAPSEALVQISETPLAKAVRT